jgi:glycosyltransferase involved in cell wall biosynthesis
MAANCPSSERLPGDPILILDEHNIEYDIVRRTAISTREIDRKLYSELNWRKLRAEERDAWRRFDGCTVTSSRDEALLLRDVPSARTAVVPNGVDVPFFSAYSAQVPDEMSLLFFGTVRYHPNLDGLLFFLREVMPRLKARYPTVKLRIVGPSVVPEIAARAGDDVEVVGLVDDVRPYIARATVVIVPLRIGGGTRFKILEAMAMGKAAVSTVVGAEGIAVRDGEDILLANDAVHFARQIGRLLDDAALRERIGAAARRLAERDYSWDASVARLEDFSVELLARQARAA